jgi:hypothetical protein
MFLADFGHQVGSCVAAEIGIGLACIAHEMNRSTTASNSGAAKTL